MKKMAMTLSILVLALTFAYPDPTVMPDFAVKIFQFSYVSPNFTINYITDIANTSLVTLEGIYSEKWSQIREEASTVKTLGEKCLLLPEQLVPGSAIYKTIKSNICGEIKSYGAKEVYQDSNLRQLGEIFGCCVEPDTQCWSVTEGNETKRKCKTYYKFVDCDEKEVSKSLFLSILISLNPAISATINLYQAITAYDYLISCLSYGENYLTFKENILALGKETDEKYDIFKYVLEVNQQICKEQGYLNKNYDDLGKEVCIKINKTYTLYSENGTKHKEILDLRSKIHRSFQPSGEFNFSLVRDLYLEEAVFIKEIERLNATLNKTREEVLKEISKLKKEIKPKIENCKELLLEADKEELELVNFTIFVTSNYIRNSPAEMIQEARELCEIAESNFANLPKQEALALQTLRECYEEIDEGKNLMETAFYAAREGEKSLKKIVENEINRLESSGYYVGELKQKLQEAINEPTLGGRVKALYELLVRLNSSKNMSNLTPKADITSILTQLQDLIDRAEKDGIDTSYARALLEVLKGLTDPELIDQYYLAIKNDILNRAKTKYGYLEDERKKLLEWAQKLEMFEEVKERLIEIEKGIVINGKINFEQGLGKLHILEEEYKKLTEELQNINPSAFFDIQVEKYIETPTIDKAVKLGLNITVCSNLPYTKYDVTVSVPVEESFHTFPNYKNGKIEMYISKISPGECKKYTEERELILANFIKSEEYLIAKDGIVVKMTTGVLEIEGNIPSIKLDKEYYKVHLDEEPILVGSDKMLIYPFERKIYDFVTEEIVGTYKLELINTDTYEEKGKSVVENTERYVGADVRYLYVPEREGIPNLTYTKEDNYFVLKNIKNGTLILFRREGSYFKLAKEIAESIGEDLTEEEKIRKETALSLINTSPKEAIKELEKLRKDVEKRKLKDLVEKKKWEQVQKTYEQELTKLENLSLGEGEISKALKAYKEELKKAIEENRTVDIEEMKKVISETAKKVYDYGIKRLKQLGVDELITTLNKKYVDYKLTNDPGKALEIEAFVSNLNTSIPLDTSLIEEYIEKYKKAKDLGVSGFYLTQRDVERQLKEIQKLMIMNESEGKKKAEELEKKLEEILEEAKKQAQEKLEIVKTMYQQAKDLLSDEERKNLESIVNELETKMEEEKYIEVIADSEKLAKMLSNKIPSQTRIPLPIFVGMTLIGLGSLVYYYRGDVLKYVKIVRGKEQPKKIKKGEMV